MIPFADMDAAVRLWLHNDPEHLEHVDIEQVASRLVTEIGPDQVNTSEYYDLVRDTVEACDDREY